MGKFHILKIKLNGIKGIDKEIELNFSNNNLTRTLNFDKTHIKAIYGANGAGKTAIIEAIEIYKQMILDDNYIALSNKNEILKNLINKIKKEFFIEITFVIVDDENKISKIYRHSIKLAYNNENNNYEIVSEALSSLKGLKLGIEENYQTIYSITNGKINKLNVRDEYYELIEKNTLNLLSTNLFCKVVLPFVFKNQIDKDFKMAIGYITLLALSVEVVLQNEDKSYIDYKNYESKIKQVEEAEKDKNDFLKPSINSIDCDIKEVYKPFFYRYENRIKSLTSFLKVFKSDLVEIEIDKKDNGETYICDLILVYEDGTKINKDFESTGIKKLIKLYSALCALENGNIVFIDEFDANIHDVLLTKLIEYIKQFSKGQFIFTTHNIEPINILQKQKHSLDFLSADSRIYSWTNNGNYSAYNMYKNGLIPYSPFNIEPVEFLGVFGDDNYE